MPNPIGATLSSYTIDQNIGSMSNYGSSVVGDETWLATAVATKGPVSVCIYASNNFENYASGWFSNLDIDLYLKIIY